MQSYFRDFSLIVLSGSLYSLNTEGVYAKTYISANIRSRCPQIEMELQNHCSHLEKLKSTNSLLQKDPVELRQKLDNHFDNAKEAITEKALGKLSVKCETLRDNLRAAADRNAEQ